jgi:glycosyltransferase involved in cell wall biosynthesis
VFLDAFSRAFEPGTATAVVIGCAMFGEEAYADGLRDLARRLGVEQDVEWRGFRDDVAAELARLDILVHASTTPEPFGQVIVEGMAAGLPVIATAAGGPLEIIRSGHDGILVPPGDPEPLARALRSLADDPDGRRVIGEQARRSSRRFSPEEACRRVLDVYAAVLQ